MGNNTLGSSALVLIATIVCLGAVGVAQPSGSGEGGKVDLVMKYAKMTAHYKNQGQHGKADAAMQATLTAYEEAVTEDPTDPQPHLYLGVFYTNIHKFKKSIEQLGTALKKLGEGNPQGTAQIQSQINKAKYGMYSMKRDKVYDQGKGNISKAYLWGKMQLKVSPQPAATHHELATMEMMLCERNTTYCGLAQDNFKVAHDLACADFAEGYTDYRRTSAQTPCEGPIKCLLGGSWQQHPDFTTLAVLSDHEQHGGGSSRGSVGSSKNGNMFLHATKTGGGLTGIGRDAVLQVHNSPACTLLLPTSDYYANLHDNIILPNRQPRTEPFTVKGEAADVGGRPVLMLAQFAGSAFYHWIAEALPRLLIAKKHWPQFDEALLIVSPSSTSSGNHHAKVPGFVLKSLELLLGGAQYLVDPTKAQGKAGVKRLGVYEPRVVYPHGGAFVTWDPQPCPVAPESAEEASRDETTVQPPRRVGCASLTHPVALRETRAALHAALDAKLLEDAPDKASSPSPYVLLAMRGKDVTMRRYDEERLHRNIVSVVSTYVSARGVGYGIRTFVGENYTLPEALTLFRGASVVVGVHGGALSNIIACRGDSKAALLEIGFKTAAARHYQHMASSLGLQYAFETVSEPTGTTVEGSAPAGFLDRALGAPEVEFNVNSVMRKLVGLLDSLDEAVAVYADEL